MGINTSEIKFPFSIRFLGKLCSPEASKNGICILFFYFPLYIALVLLRIQNGNEHLPLPPRDHWHQDRKLLLGSHDLLQWANVHHLYIHIKAIFLYLGLMAPFTFFLCRTGDDSNLLLSPQPPSLGKELMRYDFCENVTVNAWVKLALGRCGYASTHSLSGETVLVGGVDWK